MNNEQKDAGLASDLNNELDVFTTIPTETGLWLCSCDENATSVNTTWFANGLIWNDEKQEYVSVSKVADRVMRLED